MNADWNRFGDALALVLAELAERSMLTISWTTVPTVYLQFAVRVDGLTARTGADDVLGDSALTAALTALGWQPPETDPLGRRTWHASLGWPARSADYRRIAELSVRALAGVHQVPSPEQLEYRAWRDAEEPPVGVTFFEDELEPAEPHLVLDRLGVPDASAVPVDD